MANAIAKTAPKVPRVGQLEARLELLERSMKLQNDEFTLAALASRKRTTDGLIKGPTQPRQNGDPEESRETGNERMFFKGKGSKFEFYGASNPWSLISQVGLG